MFNLHQHIHHTHAPLALENSLGAVKKRFSLSHFSHLPIVDQDVFLGNMALTDAMTINDMSTVGDNRMVFEPFFARDQMNWLEILELFSKNETSMLPVLDEKNHYLGYLKLTDLLELIHTMPFLKEDGSIVMVEKNMYDYSLSQVAQIIETNNAKLLGLLISDIEDNKVQITVKIIGLQITEILQSFRRYGYDIVSEHTQDSYLKELKERSAYLDKYLNM